MTRHRIGGAIGRRSWLIASLAGFSALHWPPAWAQRTRAPDGAPALQLASHYRPGLDLSGWWVSEKYDGVRGHWDGQHLRTRGGEAITAPAWFTAGWPAEPMDGELWAGRRRFVEAQSTVAQQRADDDAWRALRFMVFDLPAHPGRFEERLRALTRAVGRIDQPWVQAAPQRKLASEAELQALLHEVERGGGEGLMLHRGTARYRAGRSKDLLKLKRHDDAEARVIAHLPGKGRHTGRLGALLVETPEGQRFALGTGFTDAERERPPPLGSWVTYRFRGRHEGSGLPRFASFVRVRADEARFRADR